MKFFNNLSIGNKFFFSSVIILGIIGFIGWQAVSTIIHCHHACAALLSGAVTTKSLAQSAQSSFYALGETANQLLFTAYLGDERRTAELKRKFDADAESLRASLDGVLSALKADPLVDKSIIGGLTDQAGSAKSGLTSEYAPLIARIAGGNSSETLSADFAQSAAASQKIAENINAVFQGIADAGDDVYRNYIIYLLDIIFKLKVSIIAAVMLSLVFVYLLGRTLQKPMRKVETAAASIAAMDFSVDISSDRNDEIGRMQRALLQIRNSLQTALQELNRNLAKTAADGERLNAVVVESSGALRSITDSMDTMRSETDTQLESVAQTSAAVDEIGASIESLNHAVQTQSAHITESSAAIEEMVANIASIRSVVSGVTKTTDTLSRSSGAGHSMLVKLAEEISRIREQSGTLLTANKTISDIAAQTNILAMNAAIEAAHAGESGKGFAVVAGEIRKLAELSGKESNAISEEIVKIEREIDQITAASGDTVGAMDAMFAEIKALDDSFAQVNRAVEEQAAGGSQILIALKTIQDMTVQVRDGAAVIRRQSGSIHGEMATLQRISQNVTSRAYEVKTACGNISSMLENTKAMAG